MNVRQALNWAKKLLEGAEVTEPESSALVLLGDVLNMNRTEIMANPEKELTALQINRFKRMVRRRRKHESVWHILGKVQFRGLEFKVTKDVLVPRPETELLIEEVLKSERNSKTTILDVGTGSGTSAIALAKELKVANVTATDLSGKALAVAKKNAKINGVADKITFMKSDLFSKVKGRFDIICANLPYIPTEDMKGLAIDVHHYEPRMALDGGRGGLEIYEEFMSQVGRYINPNGKIFCEIGINQGANFIKLVKKYLPTAGVKILGDFAGIDRIAIIDLVKK